MPYLILITAAAWVLAALAAAGNMPEPQLDQEAVLATCTTGAECEYWADRISGEGN